MGQAGAQNAAGSSDATISLGGVSVTLTPQGGVKVVGAKFVQVLDCANITGPDGKPFAAVAANGNAPAFDLNKFIGVEIDLFDNRQPVLVLGMHENKAYVGVPAKMIQVMNHRQSLEYLQKLNYAGLTGWGHPPEGLTGTMRENRLALLEDTQGKLPDAYNCLWSGAPHVNIFACFRVFGNGLPYTSYRSSQLSVWPARSLSDAQMELMQAKLLSRKLR